MHGGNGAAAIFPSSAWSTDSAERQRAAKQMCKGGGEPVRTITAFWFLVPVPSGSHLPSFQFPKTLCPCNKLSFFFFVKVSLNLFQLFENGNTWCKPYNHKINQNRAMKRTQTPDSGRSQLVSLKMGCLVHYPRLFGPRSMSVKWRI